MNTSLKDNYDAMFHHYILDAQRHKREAFYTLGMIFSTIVFFIWVWTVYLDTPMGTYGNIPTIVFTIIIAQVVYYLAYTCFIGAKIVDIKTDREEGLLESTAEGLM